MVSSSPSRKRSLEQNRERTNDRNQNVKAPRHSPTIPVLESVEELTSASFWDDFHSYSAVHVPREVVKAFMSRVSETAANTLPEEGGQSERKFSWMDIQRLFQSLEKDQSTWCIENSSKSQKKSSETGIASDDFLRPHLSSPDEVGYCSFLVQHDKGAMKTTLDRVPISTLPSPSLMKLRYGPCLWFFFGRNSSSTLLEGRPEHTDSVSHDGTWHYQLSGCKTWYLRPTNELLDTLKRKHVSDDSCAHWSSTLTFRVDCQEGDVLLVNTRLWWHRTVIPHNQSVPSVSYARDFFLDPQSDTDATKQKNPEKNAIEAMEDTMTNVDGLYAANDIEQGTVIFSEKDMPNCELHRSSTNPNCEIVQLEDGTGAVVSCRDIRAGEFFCVPESSDEEEEEE